MRKFTAILIALTYITCSWQTDKCALDNYAGNALDDFTNVSAKRIIDSLKLKPKNVRIVIDKSAYRLMLMHDSLVIKSYPVVFGFNPRDDKLRQGDGCTPEGTFHLQALYPHEKWSKFLWFNYPNTESWKKHNEAVKNGSIPSDAEIGGELGIHGVPNGADWAIDKKKNWTLGCISMKNSDVNDVYSVAFVGMTISIRK
ncbi:MAG: L,D-transpeptidase family protein [Bacteroidetes bacterium]|nr:L,D-transpeptidase family protein [Bacteroidota bacterium]